MVVIVVVVVVVVGFEISHFGEFRDKTFFADNTDGRVSPDSLV